MSEAVTQTSAGQTQEIKEKNPLGYKPVGKLLVTFSVPAIVSCLINSIYNIVDQIFIGQGVGYLGNAATTVAFPIMTILLAFGTLIGAGSSAYAAIRLGEKKEEEAERTLNNAFLFTIIIGIVLMIAGLIFLEPILTLFGATENVMPYAKDYTAIILLGTPFNLIGIVLSNLARTDGHPRMSMYGMLIGAALNTVLDPIYIFVFHWGVKGAAVATITSQIISAVVLTAYFVRKSKKPIHMRLHKQYMKLNGNRIRKFLVLGISSGITQSVACIMQVVMNNSLVHYGNESAIGGDVALSAMGIVMKIAMIMGAFGIGVGIGTQPILGFNRGAQKYERIRKTYLLAVVFASLLIFAGWIVCQTMPEQIISIFGNESNEFTQFAVNCLKIYLFCIFCAGFQIVSTTYFQATGQPMKASLLSMLRQLLLLIPLIIILPIFMGLNGILYSAPIADAASAGIVALFMIPEIKKLNKQIKMQSHPAEGNDI
ncbi:Staphylococcal virulence regulator protein A [uncultured Roseburia sp.]|uniref:Multidrug export protein MepA n=1 Tax=Brotonthovivens ammoniilytica TaxID=2981725 RepID=A0ABT2TGW1_9FIRM|nr:MATE family efflux transporter [Brotonthovivens ammoniilytica]MCU6761434.1 MATE family efflux transporter [Brotonthovivens ammoniilytica]SCI28316.1 Staphylococcal virulence regulator protein A [uncultured Roseburia sp.]